MKKRLLALTMAMIMVAGTMAACGGNDAGTTPADGSQTAPTDPAPEDPDVPADPGDGTVGGGTNAIRPVFCYFGPAWFVNFSMHCDEEGSVGIDGGWGATVGPESTFWGGTWICAANGTDNADVVADIMREMTMNADVMKQIVIDDDDFVNNKPAMEEMAASDYSSAILGGQNPLPMYCEGAENISLDYLSNWDQGCNEEFQNAMKNYFEGNYTYDQAVAEFTSKVETKYPELASGTAVVTNETYEYESSTGGSVLNIYCWNEEFKTRITDHYSKYTEVDATHGTITLDGKEVSVVWNITPSADNAYQQSLDEALLGQSSAAADDKVDMFLIEADYALKYVNSDFSLPVSELGIAASEYADQYQYTKDVVTNSNGDLKGVSWQGCPCVLFYNREIAKEVLGSDDPDEVQKAVADWATFNATATKMDEAGYNMVATVNDTYRVYSNNVTSAWVVDGKVNIDANIVNWANDAKAMFDAGYTTTYGLWSDDWAKGFYK